MKHKYYALLLDHAFHDKALVDDCIKEVRKTKKPHCLQDYMTAIWDRLDERPNK